MRSVLLALVTLSVLGASACSSSSDAVADVPPPGAVGPAGLTLTADADTYTRGDTAHFTLRNESDATYGMGVLECGVLERPADGGWEQSPEGNDRACIQIYRYLAPGETMEADVPLDVPPGTYRFSHGVAEESDDGDGETVSTAPFEVR